jgi:hypothetical protein
MVTRPKHMFTKPNYIVRPNNKQLLTKLDYFFYKQPNKKTFNSKDVKIGPITNSFEREIKADFAEKTTIRLKGPTPRILLI